MCWQKICDIVIGEGVKAGIKHIPRSVKGYFENRKIHFDYETLFKYLICISIAIAFGLLVYGNFFYQGDIYIEIWDAGAVVSDPVFSSNIMNCIAFIMGIISCGLVIEYVLLLLEKKKNRKQFRKEVFDNAREEVRTLSLFPVSLSLAVNNKAREAYSLTNLVQVSTDTSQILQILEDMKDVWFDHYDTICRIVFDFVSSHIIERFDKKEGVVVNVSVKAFFGAEEEIAKNKIITLGRCSSRSVGSGSGTHIRSKRSSWKELLSDAHQIEEDYAFTVITTPDAAIKVFRCEDVQRFRMDLKRCEEITGAKGYKNISKRKFVATLVCPICIEMQGQSTVVGAVCLDVNKPYPDWRDEETYEENVLFYTAQLIAPLVAQHMEETRIIIAQLLEPVKKAV